MFISLLVLSAIFIKLSPKYAVYKMSKAVYSGLSGTKFVKDELLLSFQV